MSFKSKQSRMQCWIARDQYWDCLNTDFSKQLPESQEPCEFLKSILESNCPSQWIKHFERKRQHLLLVDKVEKEYLNRDQVVKNDNNIRIFRIYKPI